MNAAKTSIAVFEFLDETHRTIQQQLTQLQSVMDAIERDGLNMATRETAREVLDYFNSEARQHHLDEEKHIFPTLLNSSKPEIVQAAERLTQDHGWLEENWLQIEPSLEAATRGNLWFDPAELRHALEDLKRCTSTTFSWKSPSPTLKPRGGWSLTTRTAWGAKWPSGARSSKQRTNQNLESKRVAHQGTRLPRWSKN